jgi:uncharacterized membrane protein YphA (DoxX/SURF4 family)
MKQAGSTIGFICPRLLYAFMLLIVLSAGAGPYSLDALILRLIDKRGA